MQVGKSFNGKTLLAVSILEGGYVVLCAGPDNNNKGIEYITWFVNGTDKSCHVGFYGGLHEVQAAFVKRAFPNIGE